jgi:transcriptional regulator with XRE-family HTH domain
MTFELRNLTETDQADFKADGRMRAYLSLKGAFKKRARENGVTVRALAKAIGRDKAQVSRILSGHSKGITLDTLVLITSALGFRIAFDSTPVEEMVKKNRNVAPTKWDNARQLELNENVISALVYVGGSTATANTATSASTNAAVTPAIPVAVSPRVTVAST